ncbi:Ethanolamine ammonia-lyase light chain [Burkholderiales bacterium]|nr:Ethanolamine ammonia-lyase light chain [Burkholderiales bacterium]
MSSLVTVDRWGQLRRFTAARIALGRAGNSLPTSALLEVGLAHAQARDAVHEPAQQAQMQQLLESAGFEVIAVRSAAGDREQYLRRPDLGRRLDEASRARLAGRAPSPAPDIVLVVADGLSAQARLRHALALLQILRRELPPLRLGPVVVAELARVALGDEIGQLLGARALAILLGERPGLSAPDSLGIYFTHGPAVGRTDAERNCISNVRPGGLDAAAAARKLLHLVQGARLLGRSGIDLKDESAAAGLDRLRSGSGGHADGILQL